MNDTTPHKQSAALTSFIHEIARLNGRLVMAGDQLMRGFGLSSARWKVIGAVRNSGRPQTVAWIARHIGLKRQGVQRIANELEAEGFVRLVDNPDHKRARLLELSPAGAAAFSAVMAEYEIWSNKVMEKIPEDELKALFEQIRSLREKLEDDDLRPRKTTTSQTRKRQEPAQERKTSSPQTRTTPRTDIRLPEIAPWP